jgi:hypothetical protein
MVESALRLGAESFNVVLLARKLPINHGMLVGLISSFLM